MFYTFCFLNSFTKVNDIEVFLESSFFLEYFCDWLVSFLYKAPFVGSLDMRVAATRALNIALASACDATSGVVLGMPVIFSGVETWDFATVPGDTSLPSLDPLPPLVAADSVIFPGSLRQDISDGHVHVRADMCGPVHARVRALLAGLLHIDEE